MLLSNYIALREMNRYNDCSDTCFCISKPEAADKTFAGILQAGTVPLRQCKAACEKWS